MEEHFRKLIETTGENSEREWIQKKPKGRDKAF